MGIGAGMDKGSELADANAKRIGKAVFVSSTVNVVSVEIINRLYRHC